MKVRAIAWKIGAGLERDLGVLQEVARELFLEVSTLHKITHRRIDKALTIVKRRSPLRRSIDLQISFEHVLPRYVADARINWLIPNAEWFEEAWISELEEFDLVLTKSRHAEHIFAGLGARAMFIGWTSVDQRLDEQDRDWEHPLHIAGKSRQKGTINLVNLWKRSPEFPMLTIVANSQVFEDPKLPNVNFIGERLSDLELQRLMNKHGLRLCPSHTEGFGHIICEAMSTGALVLTTNAPPMNELIDESIGVLVEPGSSRPMRLDRWHDIPLDELKRGVTRLLSIDKVEARRMGEAARARWEMNDSQTRARLKQLIHQAVQNS